MIGLIGQVGRPGLSGAALRRVAAADFTLSAAAATTIWGTVTIGDLIPVNVPAGVSFRLVNEPAGLAVVNG